MKRKKLWSVPRIRDPKHPKLVVRVGEFVPGKTLHVFWVQAHKQRSRSLGCRRVDLGKTPREQEREARRLGCLFIEEKLVPLLNGHVAAPTHGPLTLAALADRYEKEGFAGRTAGYKRDALAAVRRVAAFLDAALPIAALRPSDVQRYMAHRTDEGHAPAGRSDLVAASIACNWAVGEGMLEENPLARAHVRKLMRIQHEPRRGVVSKERYDALRKVAPQLPAAFAVILALAWHTGHRIAAILGLRWRDVSFEQTDAEPFGAITWYAGLSANRKRHPHRVPMNRTAFQTLQRWYKRRASIDGAAWVFPMPGDTKRPLTKWGASGWLKKAEGLAELPHLPGTGWHAFRRGWATIRKGMPLHDVAAAGGWTDTATVAQCYVHADAEATKKVATFIA